MSNLTKQLRHQGIRNWKRTDFQDILDCPVCSNIERIYITPLFASHIVDHIRSPVTN